MLKKIKNLDPIILITTFLLISIGIFTLFSLTLSDARFRADLIQREFEDQILFLVIGLFLSILVFAIPFYYLKLKTILLSIGAITILVLTYTIFFGLEVKGVKRWISIGATVTQDGSLIGGFSVQPSEFAKLSMIIITSALLSYFVGKIENATFLKTKIKNFFIQNRCLFLAIIFNFIVLGLVLAQKSLSVTLVLFFIMLFMIFASIENKKNAFFLFIAFFASLITSQNILFNLDIIFRIGIFIVPIMIYIYSIYSGKINDIAVLVTILAGLIFGSIFVNYIWNDVFREYQRDRVLAFVSPDSETKTDNFQQEQSEISIGAGQVFGQGFRQISDSRLLLLPEPTTDFIFAIFSFKFGFVGSVILILLFAVLVGRIYFLADKMNDRYSSLLLIGIASMILIQFFLNISMNLGLIPVGGTTLPFISAGGSSLISLMISIALVLNIISTNRMEKTIYQRRDKVAIEGWN
jgi:rod shape determining protein RodA